MAEAIIALATLFIIMLLCLLILIKKTGGRAAGMPPQPIIRPAAPTVVPTARQAPVRRPLPVTQNVRGGQQQQVLPDERPAITTSLKEAYQDARVMLAEVRARHGV